MAQVTAWRLTRHHLVEPAPARRWLSVVSAIGGLHAQLMSAAEHALAVRIDRPASDRVRRALWDDRSLVKTWAMRGTLHLIARADYPDLIGAMSTLRHFLRPSWLRYFGVTQVGLDRLLSACLAELSERGVSRQALAQRVARRTGNPKLGTFLQSGWGTLLKPLAFRGGLCFGPSEAQKVTFVRPDRWLGRLTPTQSAPALRAVARKFLASYGPSTPEEFARWLGAEGAAAKRVFRELADELIPVTVDGWRAWLLARDRRPLDAVKTPRGARLLPFFDPYTVAMSRQASRLFPAHLRTRVYRPQGWIAPVVLLDGRIAGVWERTTGKGPPTVEVATFGRLVRADRAALAREAERLGLRLR